MRFTTTVPYGKELTFVITHSPRAMRHNAPTAPPMATAMYFSILPPILTVVSYDFHNPCNYLK